MLSDKLIDSLEKKEMIALKINVAITIYNCAHQYSLRRARPEKSKHLE